VVSKEEGFRLAERLRIPFFETSALTGENVTEVVLPFLTHSLARSLAPTFFHLLIFLELISFLLQAFIELIESITSSTGPALRKHKLELKGLSTWNIKRRRELVKHIKKLEQMQASVENERLQTKRRYSLVFFPFLLLSSFLYLSFFLLIFFFFL